MLKKLFTIFIATLMLQLTVIGALAQTAELETSPRLIPGDTFYGIKTAWESIKLGMKFSDINKAEYRLELANERLREINSLESKQRVDKIEETKTRYEEEIKNTEALGIRISDLAKQKEFELKLQVAMQNHITVLERVRERLTNEQAKDALTNAIQRSNITQENTKVIIKSRNETMREELEIETNGRIRIKVRNANT